MDILFHAIVGATVVAAALASITFWAPSPTRVRILAVVVTTLFIPIAYVQLVEMLSKPKPMSFEWYERAREKGQVLGVSLYEKESIYLWLRLPGSFEPRYYKVPWNLRLADKLQKAVTKAARGNSTVVLEDPFSKRILEEWGNLNVAIIPPSVPRMKHPPPPPQIFNPRERSI